MLSTVDAATIRLLNTTLRKGNTGGWMGERCFLKTISCGFVYGRMRQGGAGR